MKCPDGLEYWTPDEVANCIDCDDLDGPDLYNELCSLVEDDQPVGGDGSDGTCEEPVVQTYSWWDKLSEAAQARIANGYEKDYD